MKKFLISLIFVFVSLFITNDIYAISSADANEKIDLDKKSSLTINYHYDNYNFDGFNVKIYYIAKITSDYKYELSSSFLNSNIKIDKITSIEKWNLLKESLNIYIENNDIEEKISKTIENNKVFIANLKPGLYLVQTETINNKRYTLFADSFLINIPTIEEDGTWNYDVSAYPKTEYLSQTISQNPDTSDNIKTYLYLMFGSLLFIVVIIRFKSKNKN